MRDKTIDKMRLRQNVLAGIECDFLEYVKVELPVLGENMQPDFALVSFPRKQSEFPVPPQNLRLRVWKHLSDFERTKQKILLKY